MSNVLDMSVTAETSHFEMSPLNSQALNVLDMSVTAETSQSPIGPPCGPLAQLPTGDIFQHVSTAAFSSDLVRGLNTAVEAG